MIFLCKWLYCSPIEINISGIPRSVTIDGGTPYSGTKLAPLNQGSSTPLTPSARISALNIVGDLLRKVGVSVQVSPGKILFGGGGWRFTPKDFREVESLFRGRKLKSRPPPPIATHQKFFSGVRGDAAIPHHVI